jgi:hypothetical protein
MQDFADQHARQREIVSVLPCTSGFAGRID